MASGTGLVHVPIDSHRTSPSRFRLKSRGFVSSLVCVLVLCAEPGNGLRASGFRMRGRKCRRVLTNSLHGMAAAAVYLKASRRRGCNLRCELVLVLPWQVLVSSSVGVPRASTLADNNIRDRRHFQDYFRRVQARTDEACTVYVLTYDAQRIVTMRSPFRDTARVE